MKRQKNVGKLAVCCRFIRQISTRISRFKALAGKRLIDIAGFTLNLVCKACLAARWLVAV